ncbi:response regulator [Spirosoma agri]|uniref:Response regulator n=1 Tax=Spirosoma agri TaxID=1987381 RepID=A0A6M0IQL1_9BACT|nr:response regulator [Spirosoma agri]NEU70197.1 response regulator [Spirosoma agri]
MEEAPIIFIDADEDDQLMFKQALADLSSSHPPVVFSNGETALDYLVSVDQAPFLILSEISMPGMNGLELRQQIDKNPTLKKQLIPFVFLSYPIHDNLVEQAYDLTIQGLFEKKLAYEDWKTQLRDIIAYWTACHHPKKVKSAL